VLERLWRWLRRRFAADAQSAPFEDGNSRTVARARFWSELRAGQREAEARNVGKRGAVPDGER